MEVAILLLSPSIPVPCPHLHLAGLPFCMLMVVHLEVSPADSYGRAGGEVSSYA